MATNRKPLIPNDYVTWLNGLLPQRQRLLWCDECHYWHQSINECAYVTPRVGAGRKP